MRKDKSLDTVRVKLKFDFVKKSMTYKKWTLHIKTPFNKKIKAGPLKKWDTDGALSNPNTFHDQSNPHLPQQVCKRVKFR